jgi:prepilin-type processing-associated H-X9-DG protein
MRAQRKGRLAGFTIVELLVIIGGLLCILALFGPTLRNQRQARTVACILNLKQIGVAYRVWAEDNGDKMPAQVPLTNGGWLEIASQSNAAAFLWTNYALMANELGQSPGVLPCPKDDRVPATNFSAIHDNSPLSYFAGVEACDAFPQSLLGGDRNMAPGLQPKDDFGYASTNCRGNEVRLQTNSPVCWSLKIHSKGNLAGAGNLLFADGSVQQTSSGSLRANCIPKAGIVTPVVSSAENTNGATQTPVSQSTNAPAPTIRLLFP